MLLNGQPASAEDLRALALANYGHFTSMQVRGRAVQGLEMHRQRLAAATRELFGSELDFPTVQAQMRQAVANHPDATLRVTVFCRSFDHRRPGGTHAADVLISLSPPSLPCSSPLRVKSFPFQRPLAHIKHVGTFPLSHYRRLAMAQGFDDALFVDEGGQVSEGSFWNVGFWDGERIVWPDASALRGTAELRLQDALGERGVEQRIRPVRMADLAGFRAAFACNASGLTWIAAMDGMAYPEDPALRKLLDGALAAGPWQTL